MADSTEEEELEKYMAEIFEAARAVYMEMVEQYLQQTTVESLSKGGDLYMELQGLAIAGAAAWYGMYSPEVYQRSYSMTDPANILIESYVGADGSIGYSVTNVSPNAKYAEGFWFYKRGQPFFRPGGDLMKFIPEELEHEVVLTQEVANDLFGAALAAVL